LTGNPELAVVVYWIARSSRAMTGRRVSTQMKLEFKVDLAAVKTELRKGLGLAP
jgi:hypothetical protein